MESPKKSEWKFISINHKLYYAKLHRLQSNQSTNRGIQSSLDIETVKNSGFFEEIFWQTKN